MKSSKAHLELPVHLRHQCQSTLVNMNDIQEVQVRSYLAFGGLIKQILTLSLSQTLRTLTSYLLNRARKMFLDCV